MNAKNDSPIIEVQHLSFRRNGRIVLHDVSFEIREHELVGLIGPNGGGKTSLLQTLLGVLHPYEGVIRVLGREPERLDKARGQIG